MVIESSRTYSGFSWKGFCKSVFERLFHLPEVLVKDIALSCLVARSEEPKSRQDFVNNIQEKHRCAVIILSEHIESDKRQATMYKMSWSKRAIAAKTHT